MNIGGASGPTTHYERIMREIRRRTQVVGNFPDGNSTLMLVTARLRHIACSHWGTHEYRDVKKIHETDKEQVA